MNNKRQGIYTDLKRKIHEFVKLVYITTEKFPKSELYGSTSQVRRASMSIMLNFLEGFARFKPKVKLNSFETSYGSNRECRYVIFFALEMKWIGREEYDALFGLSDDMGAMLYKIISGLQKDIDESES